VHIPYVAITILAALANGYAASLDFVGAESIKVVADRTRPLLHLRTVGAHTRAGPPYRGRRQLSGVGRRRAYDRLGVPQPVVISGPRHELATDDG
jgi:hypothetical protein